MMTYPKMIRAAAAASILLAAASAVHGAGQPQFFDQDGLRVEMTLDSLDPKIETVCAHDDVALRFSVEEARENGGRVAGLDPLAWLVGRDEGDGAPDRDACEYQIRALLAGRLARAADVNLNEYLLVTLDDNNSVSIIDPQIESSKTKTLGMVALTSKGADFVLAADRRSVLVTLPEQGRLAAADLFIRKARYLEVGGRPERITLQPDGRTAWVSDQTGTAVHAIDTSSFELRGSIEVGPGPHELAFDADRRKVFVASVGSTHLVIVDTDSVAIERSVEVGEGTVAIAFSAHSGQAYVARAGGEVVAIDPERGLVTATIKLDPGLTGFAIGTEGRFGLALHRDQDRLTAIDLSSHTESLVLATERAPEAIAFTDTFAYVTHGESADALLVDVASLATKTPISATVVMGRKPASELLGPVAAPQMAPLPEGGGALVLNASDRTIYHFMEGMNAPMGAYRTYPWPARGVLLSDRTIRETERGLYQTEFRVPRDGTYTLAFLVPSSPQLYGCFTVEVEPQPRQERLATIRSLRIEPLPEAHRLTPGVVESVQVRLLDPASGRPVTGLDDVMVLVMRRPQWSWRGAAREVGDGYYEVELTVPRDGQYMVMVRSPSRGVEFGDIASIPAWAGAQPDDPISASSGEVSR